MERQCPSFDRISTLPSYIIETILCLVPIKEAARTSILSKQWRYKWTKIPKLEFYDDMFEESAENENLVSISEQTIPSVGRVCKVFYAIYQVLFHLKYFTMDFMSFDSPDQLRFLARLIRSSPNLEKLELHAEEMSNEDGMVFVVREAYSDISLDHLKELDIRGLTCFSKSKHEFEFVKFIVGAKSPKLKKVSLKFHKETNENEQFDMLETLALASPLVEFSVTFDRRSP